MKVFPQTALQLFHSIIKRQKLQMVIILLFYIYTVGEVRNDNDDDNDRICNS